MRKNYTEEQKREKRNSIEVGNEKALKLVEMIERTKKQEGERATFKDDAGTDFYVDGNTGLVSIFKDRKIAKRIATWDKQEVYYASGISSNGYIFVSVNFDGEDRKVSIHNLMFAMLRTEEYKECMSGDENFVINHMNGCRVDNHIQNLECVSDLENHLHGSALRALRVENPELFTTVWITGPKAANVYPISVLKDKKLSAKECGGLAKMIADMAYGMLEDSNIAYSGKY